MPDRDKVYIVLEVDDKGTAVVRRFDKETERAFSDMKKNARFASEGMGSSLQTLRRHWLAVTAAMTSVIYVFSRFIKSASDLEEVTSKFEVVFAGQVKRAEQWAQTLRESYAMSTREARQYLSSVQDLLVPMGMQADAAGKLSFEIVKLAADLGSFNNMPTARVMDDIQSALVGNYETMKKYGVVLNATVVQEKALAMGLADTKKELTANERAQAAYALMVQGSQAAIGDHARTAESAANSTRAFNAAVEDLMAELGKELLPALAVTARYLTEIIKDYNAWVKGPSMMDKLKADQKEIASQIEALRSKLRQGWELDAFGDDIRLLTEADNREIQIQIGLLETRLALIGRSINEENRLAAAERARGRPGGGPGKKPPPPVFTEEDLADTQRYIDYMTTEMQAEQYRNEQRWREYQRAHPEDEFLGLDKQIEEAGYLQAAAEMRFHQEMEQLYAENDKAVEKHFDFQKSLADETARAMHRSFADFFFDAMTGEFDSLSDYITGFLRSVQMAFANVLAEQFVGSLGLSGLFGVPEAHGGGIIGITPMPVRIVSPDIFSGAPRLHRGLAADEFPAILQKGEEVSPRGGRRAAQINLNFGGIRIDATDAESFTRLVARNPKAIEMPIVKALVRGGELRDLLRSVVR